MNKEIEIRTFGEYEPQKATVLLFPYRNDIWRKQCIPAEKMIVDLANVISQFQKVVLGVTKDKEEYLKTNYELNENVQVEVLKYNDAWARDTIGSPVKYGDKCYIPDFKFNAYGGELYYPWKDDDTLNKQVGKIFKYTVKKSDVTTEGGNLMPDGAGTMFAVEDAIINKNRNRFKKPYIENAIKKVTGSTRVVWIPNGLKFDETGGHIDNIIAFADKDTLLLSYTDDKTNANYEICQVLYELLKGINKMDGAPYNIVKIPLPPITFRTEDECEGIIEKDGSFARVVGDPVLETYINFALINDAVIVPQFGIDMDKEAIDVLQKVFPDRTIVPFYCREAALGGGGIHCLTKNIN